MKKGTLYIFILLAILILFPFVYATFRPNLILSKAEVKAKLALPSSHFIQWRGAEIHYTDEGQGVPVLMLHGFGGSFLNWNKLCDRMKDDYRIIRLDLPGFGISDLPEPDGAKTQYVQQYRDFMSFFLDTLHVDSIYVIGNSMGGLVGWDIAAAHPDKVKKLVLISSAGYDLATIAGHVSRAMKIPFMDYFAKKGMSLSLSEGMAKSVYADPSKVDIKAVKNNNMMWNREGNLHAAYDLMSSGQFPDSAMIRNVECPTLIIWGRQDKVIPLDHAYRFQRDIKGSKLIVLDSCGHCAMLERPDETAAAIKEFFRREQ